MESFILSKNFFLLKIIIKMHIKEIRKILIFRKKSPARYIYLKKIISEVKILEIR